MIYHECALCRIGASWNRQCCCRYPTLLRVFDEFGFGAGVAMAIPLVIFLAFALLSVLLSVLQVAAAWKAQTPEARA